MPYSKHLKKNAIQIERYLLFGLLTLVWVIIPIVAFVSWHGQFCFGPELGKYRPVQLFFLFF
jgi:hypothetical protein